MRFRKRKSKPKPCAVCGVLFFPQRAAKTCSDECAAELLTRSRARYRANNMPRIRYLDRLAHRRYYADAEKGAEMIARARQRHRENRETINARRRERRARLKDAQQ